mgnify:FL=1
MIRKYIVKVQDWVDDHLRRLCGRITPEKRLIVLLTMFLFFGIASVYIFVSAIYTIGKNEGRQIEIEHMQMLELQKRDSINQLKIYDNGGEQD